MSDRRWTIRWTGGHGLPDPRRMTVQGPWIKPDERIDVMPVPDDAAKARAADSFRNRGVMSHEEIVDRVLAALMSPGTPDDAR